MAFPLSSTSIADSSPILRTLQNPTLSFWPLSVHRYTKFASPPHRRFLLLRASTDPHGPIINPPRRRNAPNPLLQAVTAPLVFFLVGISAATAASAGVHELPPAIPAVTSTSGNVGEDGERGEEELEREFELWKKKKFPWTVPLRVVSLRGSFPASWLKDFVQSQGKRLKLQPEFRPSLLTIYQQLASAFENTTIGPKSVMAADMVTIGDTWLSHAINAGIIEPIHGADREQWFNDLDHLWKIFLRRNDKGVLDSNGSIWGAPYRWGNVVIAFRKEKFQQNNLTPIEDWGDLWRPELGGKISMVASPREVVGSVLKYMGASYNTKDIDSEVAGGRKAVMQNLALLQRQVRLFDSTHYLKAFTAGDVWVAVGWSSDVLPTAKRMSNVAVIVPRSGSSFWADIWAIPAASKFNNTDQIGGRIRGPSPLIHQWVDFCLQPARAFAFQQEIIPGASPSALQRDPAAPTIPLDGAPSKAGGPTFDTNLVAGVPPPEILARCEFLEPLSEKGLLDHQWLIDNMQKRPSSNFASSLADKLSRVFRGIVGNPNIRSVSS